MNNGKVRIYELSRELNLDNKDILAVCERLNISVKSHSSTITESEAERIRKTAEKYVASHSSPGKPAPTERAAAPSRESGPHPNDQQKKQQILEIRSQKYGRLVLHPSLRATRSKKPSLGHRWQTPPKSPASQQLQSPAKPNINRPVLSKPNVAVSAAPSETVSEIVSETVGAIAHEVTAEDQAPAALQQPPASKAPERTQRPPGRPSSAARGKTHVAASQRSVGVGDAQRTKSGKQARTETCQN